MDYSNILKTGSVENVKNTLELTIREINQIHSPGDELNKKQAQLKIYIDILRDRIISGNNKLMEAWDSLEKINNESEFKMQATTWKSSCDKLIALSQILMRSGFIGCLYTSRRYEEEKNYKCKSWPEGHFCIACGDSDIFWNEVIEKLPSPERAPVSLSKDDLIFLNELASEV